MSEFLQEGEDRIGWHLAGKPDVVGFKSFSTDDMGFLSADEKAVVMSAPAGYDLAQLIRDVFATHESGPDALNAIKDAIAAATEAANAVTGIAPPSNSPTDHVIN